MRHVLSALLNSEADDRTAADVYMGTDLHITAKNSAWCDMSVCRQTAIVVNTGACIHNTVVTYSATGLDGSTGHDLHPCSQRRVFRNTGPWMYHGGKMKSGLVESLV